MKIFNIFCSPKYYFRYSINLIFIFLLIFVLYIILLSSGYSKNHQIECVSHDVYQRVLPNLPVVKIYGIQEEEKKLDIVKNLFTKMGYRVDLSNTSHWDVLWSHTYPFYSLRNEILNLKHYQKPRFEWPDLPDVPKFYLQMVNHFPGSGYITQKNNLAALAVDSIPKSFLLPANKEAFFKYAEENKNVFWMIKNSNHRGIRILNGTENLNMEGTFVQEFIKDPLLINGKKFDIGVYVVLTSIDPLRVYMYSGDVLLRFCKENYFPLNINSVGSYVVSDDYLPVWEVPDLRYFYSELNHTAKESLNGYLHSKGKSTRYMWSRILKIIQDVYYSVEDDLKRSALSLGNLRNFFELVRFDFIADEYLNVYLLEVNMSPNLSPAHFPQNSLLYEQIVFNSLQLVGLIRKFHSYYGGEAEVSEKDVQVNAEQCISQVCENSCKELKCKICNHCMDRELREVFKSAYTEFMNRGKFHRIIPAPIVKTQSKSTRKPSELSQMNAYMDMWFKGKCLQDSSWC